MGAWIETLVSVLDIKFVQSLPSWERGLKLPNDTVDMNCNFGRSLRGSVDGNISRSEQTTSISLSLPSWERGLKQDLKRSQELLPIVAPFVGAWIETDRQHGAEDLV